MKDLAGKEVLDGDMVYVFYASQSSVVMALAVVVGRTNTSLRIYREAIFNNKEKEKPERKLSTHVLKINYDEAIAFSNKFENNVVVIGIVLEMIELSKQILGKVTLPK